jgi:hypothetical protein
MAFAEPGHRQLYQDAEKGENPNFILDRLRMS